VRTGDAKSSVRAILDWMRAEMTYEPGQTVVGTSVAELLRTRRGVCQDFAHLSCALLRANEIPARYVSGYFVPRPLGPGEEVEAQSHAWVEALIPGWGWWAVDPTNHLTCSDRHVTVGHGRDYSDIVPFQGVHVGAAGHTLEVSVTIRRVD
jgi:transglutaminase-like putative cysteine protease